MNPLFLALSLLAAAHPAWREPVNVPMMHMVYAPSFGWCETNGQE